MSQVIKKVPLVISTIQEPMAECNKCSSGYILEEGHQKYEEYKALIGTKCGCGGMIESTIFEYQQKDGGYTLVKCDCGEEIACSGFTTTCGCGRDYDWNGTQLAPRSQWGYETGEVF